MESWSECPELETIRTTDDWELNRSSYTCQGDDSRTVQWTILTKHSKIDVYSDLVGDPLCDYMHDAAIEFAASVRAGNDCYIAVSETSNVDASWAVRNGDTVFDFTAQSIGCGFVFNVPGIELAQTLADDLVLVTGLKF
jgi:hypothetical protein